MLGGFKIGERVDSDHAPLTLKLKGQGEVQIRRDKRNEIGKRTIFSWSEEEIQAYWKKTNNLYEMQEEDDNIEALWKEVQEAVNESVTKKECKIKNWKLGMKKWWDVDCAKSKREVKKAYREWKKGKTDKTMYLEKRREWRALCKKKEKGHKEKEEEKIRNIKNDSEVWKFLNRGKKKRQKR